MATTKTKTAPKVDDNFIAEIRAKDSAEPEQAAADPATDQTTEQAKQKKVLVNFQVNADTVKQWKQFCLENDITLTSAIKHAMKYYISVVSKGEI